MVGDSAFCHKMDYFINLEEHLNRITGSRVTVILLYGWILPIGEALAVEGLLSTGLHYLVFCNIPNNCPTCFTCCRFFLYKQCPAMGR